MAEGEYFENHITIPTSYASAAINKKINTEAI